jgi:hypothetical protein
MLQYIIILKIELGTLRYGSSFIKNVSSEFSLIYVIQTGSGVRPTSYPMGTGDSVPGGKAAGT